MFNLYIIAGMLLAFGIYLLISSINHIRNGIRIEATVIDTHFVPATNDEDHDKLNVTFQFHTFNNEEITFTRDFGTDCKFQPGDKYSVAYKEYNPHDIISLDYSGSFGVVGFIFSVALILITIATGYYWARNYIDSLPISK